MDPHRPLTAREHDWLAGRDVYPEDYEEEDAHEMLKRRFPVEYVKTHLNVLEDLANDLRKQADSLRDQVKSMRKLISEDDF